MMDAEVVNVAGSLCADGQFQKQRSLPKSNSVVRRQASKKGDEYEGTQRQLIEEEERETGSIGFGVYWTYAIAVCKGAPAIAVIMCQFGFMVIFRIPCTHYDRMIFLFFGYIMVLFTGKV